MKDYNREARIKKIVESNEYLVQTIKSRLIPTKLMEVIANGRHIERFHSFVKRSD